MDRQWRVPAVFLTMVLCSASVLHAATPAREFPYVRQTGLAPGTYQFVFSLYDSPGAATPLWTSGTTRLTLRTPLLVYTLGSGASKIPAGVDFSQQLYVRVVKTSPAPAAVIVNRERLPSVPFALHARSVSPGSIDTSSILDGTVGAVDLADGAVLGEILDDDGEGSGLDADLLDGRHAAAFADEGHTHGYVTPGQADSVTAAMIVDGAIADADIGATAAIADSKLATIASAGKVADSALSANVDLLDAAGTVTGLKTFSPAGETVPFIVAAPSAGKVGNLNADLLDGRHAGNGAGEVAVNNGALNAGLYAERADRLGNLTLADLDARYGVAAPPAGGVLHGYLLSRPNYSPNNLGQSSSIAIGADGMPIIAYGDFTLRKLLLQHCTDAACSNTTMISSPAGGSAGISLAIGADGLPVISLIGPGDTCLEVVHCQTPDCGTSSVSTPDPEPFCGTSSSLAIGADGLPIVTYTNESGGLLVLHCGDVSCSANNTISVVDPLGSGDWFPSIAIGTDGLPVISYWDGYGNSDLRVLHCGSADCSTGNTSIPVDTEGQVGYRNAIAIGADGLPVISYSDMSNGHLKVAHCGNADCSAGNTVTTADPAPLTGYNSSITIGAGGFPVIAYNTDDPLHLKVLRCGNAVCTAGNAFDSIEAGAVYSTGNPSITIGTDGLPLISYHAGFPLNSLKVAKGFLRPLGRR